MPIAYFVMRAHVEIQRVQYMYNVDRLRPIKRVHVDKLHHRISAHEKVKEAIIRASIHTVHILHALLGTHKDTFRMKHYSTVLHKSRTYGYMCYIVLDSDMSRLDPCRAVFYDVYI